MEFCVTNLCNNRCIMCTNSAEFSDPKNNKGYEFDELIERIGQRAEHLLKTKEPINITGGEPTIVPHFVKLLNWLRKNFPRNEIVCVSNGRMFSYEDFAKQVLRVDNLKLEIAFHGHTPRLYDEISGVKGGFPQTLQGIKNILRFRNDSHLIETRTVIIRQNHKRLDDILGFVHENFKGLDTVVLIFHELEGQCGDHLGGVAVSYKDIEKEVVRNIEKWSKKIDDLRLYHFPLCVLPSGLWPHTWRTLPAREVSFPDNCAKCLYRKYCMGVHNEYRRLVGDEEFKPVDSKILLKTSRGQEFIYHPIVAIGDQP
ncbi:MAG TPA: radical SAM protein [Candidatus Colwellbacteria bacterium]|nr:radical SAM protein [Candidatus Colwellbacteria bacterium]